MKRTANRNDNESVANEGTRKKMAEDTELGPRKTILILAIVAGCFAVLWPKIFYPMLTGPATTTHTPVNVPACCDVIFESDVNTVDIMQEMCKNILRHHQVDPRVRDALKSSKLTPQSASFCRDEVLARCGIDLSSFLAEKERLGKTYKQVLEEIRSFNSSLCLKMQFGVPLSQLGTPHLIRYHILMPHSPIRQERRTPPHAGGLHPALQERGRAIPSSHIVPKVGGRPDHVVVQKMRPPLGAAGRVVPAPSGTSGMGIIMPLYTLAIVLFFLYTIAKILRKNADNEIYAEYPNAAAEKEFRNKVFNPEALASAITGTPYYRKERSASPVRPIPTMEELKELDGAPKSNGPAGVPPSLKLQDQCTSRSCCNRSHNGVEEFEEASNTVKVMGMEMTACCEGGQKISRPTTPIIQPHSHVEREFTPPKPIYLEGALPPQCELLVSDSETQAENSEDDAEAAVVLSGKMTLSLISHDQNQAESETENLDVEENCKRIENEKVNSAGDHDSVRRIEEPKKQSESVKTEEDTEGEDDEEDEADEEDDEEDEVDDEDEVDEDVSEEAEDEEEEVEAEVHEKQEDNKSVTNVTNVTESEEEIETDEEDEVTDEEEGEESEEIDIELDKAIDKKLIGYTKNITDSEDELETDVEVSDDDEDQDEQKEETKVDKHVKETLTKASVTGMNKNDSSDEEDEEDETDDEESDEVEEESEDGNVSDDNSSKHEKQKS